MSGDVASYLLKLAPICLDELWKGRSKDQTRVCACSLPLRFEKLEQHWVSVESLCNCLCNLWGGRSQTSERQGTLWQCTRFAYKHHY